MIPGDGDEGENGRNLYQLAIESRDPATAFRALAGILEDQVETHARLIETVDPDENPAEWSRAKGLLDASRSAAVTARTVALAWDGRDGDREEVKK